MARLAAALAASLGLMLAGCGGLTVMDDARVEGAHPFPLREATAGVHAHSVHGIDVAKYQGEIDWPALATAGVSFAFIKATEGADRLDDRFHQNWAAAKAAGIPRAAYHFNYWCSPIEDQIEWFKKHVPVDPDAMPPVLDLEWNPQSPTCPRRIPREEALPRIKKFLVALERHYGKRPIIYTDGHFYRDILEGELEEYPLWVSDIRGLPQDRYKGRRWAFWQHSFRGQMPGIRGRVDRNVFAGTREQWNALVAARFTGDGATVAAAADEERPSGLVPLPKEAPLPPARPDAPTVVAEDEKE